MLVSGILICSIAVAQKDSSGIYKTAYDFQQSKLSFAINCTTEKHKIKLNDFFGKPYITVVHNDSSYEFFKAKIFGYQTCDGQIVRFLKKKELLLLNPTESIMIYRYDIPKPPRGKTNVTNYYFSKDAGSSVLSLTISNLKMAFPESHAFHMKLDELFKYNTELAAYDDNNKMYRVNSILVNNSK